MSVGENLKAKRKEKEISAAALEKEIGLSHSTIVRYENGTVRIIPRKQLEKIAGVFDCRVEDLTEGDFRYTAGKRVSSDSITDEELTVICK